MSPIHPLLLASLLLPLHPTFDWSLVLTTEFYFFFSFVQWYLSILRDTGFDHIICYWFYHLKLYQPYCLGYYCQWEPGSHRGSVLVCGLLLTVGRVFCSFLPSFLSSIICTICSEWICRLHRGFLYTFRYVNNRLLPYSIHAAFITSYVFLYVFNHCLGLL